MTCLLDLDGSFSREVLAASLVKVEHTLDSYDWQGVARLDLLPGSIGSDARAIGGALLPLHATSHLTATCF